MSVSLILIPCDFNKPLELHTSNKDELSKTLRDLIGDYFEVIPTDSSMKYFFSGELGEIIGDLLFVCDENGLNKNLPHNERASLLCGTGFVGNVVMFMENKNITLENANKFFDQ